MRRAITARSGTIRSFPSAAGLIARTLQKDLRGYDIGVSVLCPMGVHTQIRQSDRNRPTALRNPRRHHGRKGQGIRPFCEAVQCLQAKADAAKEAKA